MTDIVERLRDMSVTVDQGPLRLAAAVEIERLRERVRQLTFLLDQQMGTPCEQIRHEQEIERLHTPICIGRTIIQTLARDGTWQSENGNGVIAADELFRNDPYAEIERLRNALKAVDDLWSWDAQMGFEEEMSPPSPVGMAWAKVKSALANGEQDGRP